MGPRRALAILLVLLVAVFAVSFGLGRALRGEPGEAEPPPPVAVPGLRLPELGEPAELPSLRPAPAAPMPTTTAP